MTSKELLPSPRRVALEEQHADERRAALERLEAETETASPERAAEIMLQTSVIRDALKKMGSCLEESRQAGKTSVLAARRLGILLLELSNETKTGFGWGSQMSPRGLLCKELGLQGSLRSNVLAIGRGSDPDFQRYIQRSDLVPSVNGAATACRGLRPSQEPLKVKARTLRRRRRGLKVKAPLAPSVDKSYSAIIDAIRNLDALIGSGRPGQRGVAIKVALAALYEAEDALKPFLGGYGE